MPPTQALSLLLSDPSATAMPARPSTTTAPIGIRLLGIDGPEIPHEDKPG